MRKPKRSLGRLYLESDAFVYHVAILALWLPLAIVVFIFEHHPLLSVILYLVVLGALFRKTIHWVQWIREIFWMNR